jgi:hypothetical protein
MFVFGHHSQSSVHEAQNFALWVHRTVSEPSPDLTIILFIIFAWRRGVVQASYGLHNFWIRKWFSHPKETSETSCGASTRARLCPNKQIKALEHRRTRDNSCDNCICNV